MISFSTKKHTLTRTWPPIPWESGWRLTHSQKRTVKVHIGGYLNRPPPQSNGAQKRNTLIEVNWISSDEIQLSMIAFRKSNVCVVCASEGKGKNVFFSRPSNSGWYLNQLHCSSVIIKNDDRNSHTKMLLFFLSRKVHGMKCEMMSASGRCQIRKQK